MIVSTTDLTLDTYGADFFNEYAARMGITTINDDHFRVAVGGNGSVGH